MALTKKALVLCSGGIDSSTLLAQTVEAYGSENVVGLCISYGQRHVKELTSAKNIAKFYDVSLHHVDVSSVFVDSGCSLLERSCESLPQVSYADQLKKSDGGFISTYVPFRNGLFLSAATSCAICYGCSIVFYGAHKDDWAGNAYPDCSLSFVAAMDRAIQEGTAGKVALEAPFGALTKADIVKAGLELNVPYELTWSCYAGGYKPCGLCATCRERSHAFAQNGVEDPLLQ